MTLVVGLLLWVLAAFVSRLFSPPSLSLLFDSVIRFFITLVSFVFEKTLCLLLLFFKTEHTCLTIDTLSLVDEINTPAQFAHTKQCTVFWV